ncbi:MAG: GNAT family N-acetyltransferase [Symploca sp. SIO3E6]|nr:GNAT family N-acetyltransferase [Caldora sp. SIO3E6]
MTIITATTFRPITPADLDFLYQVYASTREEELAVVDWSPEQKASFLEMQFNTQHTYYLQQFKQATFEIIEQEGKPIGRLYLDRRQTEIRIIDIALLPSYRNQGIGSRLLKDILAQGKQLGLPVRIHVEQFNPALRLYQRLGFQKIDDHGVYYLMEWSP